MSTFAVTAVGRDRPGIVAGISEALLGVDGNIEDSRMAILRGHFAVMLIVEVPESQPAGDLRARLGEAAERLGLEALAVEAIDDAHAAAQASPTHVLTVYGADHPGIVHAVSSALAELSVNICNLQTQVSGEGSSALYVMIMELEVAGPGVAALRDALDRVGTEASVDVSLRELEDEVL